MAELIRSMAAAGATPEAIAIAVEAIEQRDEAIAAKRAVERDRKRRQRERAGTVTGQSRDNTGTVTGLSGDNSLSASPPRDIINPPITSPSSTSLRSVERAEPKPKRSKARTAIGEDARPLPADAKAAVDAGLSGEQFLGQWRKFRDYHRAKGSLMADWSAAWRTWLGNMGQFQARAGPKPITAADMLASIYREEADERQQNQSEGHFGNVSRLPLASPDRRAPGDDAIQIFGDDGDLLGRHGR